MIKSVLSALIKGYKLTPQLHTSKLYKHWLSTKDMRRCTECRELHGKIWLIKETPDIVPPIHLNGRCSIEPLSAISAGTATIDGVSGADYTLKYSKQLPNNYVNKSEAYNLGWKEGKWPSNFLPDNAIITSGIYKNKNGHLPEAEGRIWYEADINYTTGQRNAQRILWSNDGLIFVTYDHYETFYEIV